jgi:formylmethanofuran dehydrogenase subunit E
VKRFKQNNPSVSKSVKGQKMIACDVCDTHVPESDVIVKNGKNYCSIEHAE